MISIGTMNTPGQSLKGSLKDLVARIVKPATEKERTGKNFEIRHSEMENAGSFFRFDVTGLGITGLDEHKEGARIVTRTRTYLQDPTVAQRLRSCIEGHVDPTSIKSN